MMLPRKTPGHLQPLQNLWDVLDLAQDISKGLHHVWRTHQCLNGILQGSSTDQAMHGCETSAAVVVTQQK